MASNETSIVVNTGDTTGGAAAANDAETITDIQNYLQSFNKEIGEATVQSADPNQPPQYYTIDASQVLPGSGDGSAAIAAGQTVQVANAQGGGDGDSAYQTLAILPDSVNGGYVLIVQPTAGSGTSQAIPVSGVQSGTTIALTRTTSGQVNTNANITSSLELTEENRDDDLINDAGALTRIKQERVDLEKPNDISVYDFEDVNPPHSSAVDDEEVEDEAMDNETDDMQTDASDVKPNLVTPKSKRTRRSAASTAKKIKTPAPQTPSNPNQHMCSYCNYTSGKRYLLSRHMKSHSEERPHKCGICERGFKTIASLQNHVNTHTGVRPHGCKYCEMAFTTSGELVRHVRYRHTHEKPHRCSECDYASVELSKLKRHMRCHTGERPYQCPHCTYASPDTYKLKRHLRIHTGEKPYECDVCHARFTQSNSLKAHRLIHSGNKPIFKCDQCPTTCGRKTDLRIHVQKLHTSDRPLTCKRCDQTFADRYSFKIHLKSHEGEKCFKCDLCNYASVSARHLESHMLIHTDQKPYECDECDQSFRQKQLLKRHKNLYHNPEYVPPQPKEKTHECPHCSKAFRHKGNLMRHLVVHDPDAYKDVNFDQSSRMNDSSQLIDDEDEESDEDESQIVMPSAGEESTLDPHTLQFTLDPQTQQMISGEQVVVFEVVQLNEENESQNSTAYATLDQSGSNAILSLDQTSTPMVGVGGKKRTAILTTPAGQKIRAATLRNASIITSNGNASKQGDNIIIQLQAEDEEAANVIQGSEAIIEETSFSNKSALKLSTSMTGNQSAGSVVVPPPIMVPDDTKQIRDQIQKQKDLAECFGFKDDDEEDEAILSMPAAHAQ